VVLSSRVIFFENYANGWRSTRSEQLLKIPLTNGMVERYHRTLNSILGKIVREDQRNWCEKVPIATAAYRRFPSSSERRRHLDTERTKGHARDPPSSSRVSSHLPSGRRGQTPGELRAGSEYDRGERNRRLQRHRERDFSRDREKERPS